MEDLIDIAILLILYVFVFYRRWSAKGKRTLLINTLMYLYLAAVLYFTLMPIIASLPFIFDHRYIPMNLTPFIDVSYGRGDFVRQIVLNVIMTIPFGFLLPFTNPRKAKFSRTILLTFLLSFSIEIIQPLLSSARSSDITDIITNVLGGAIGYLIFLACRPLLVKLKRVAPEMQL